MDRNIFMSCRDGEIEDPSDGASDMPLLCRAVLTTNIQPVWLSSTWIETSRINLRLDSTASRGTTVSVGHVGQVDKISIG